MGIELSSLSDDQRTAIDYLLNAKGGLSQALKVALDSGNSELQPLATEHHDIATVIDGLVSYYMQTKTLIHGYSYGSDKMHDDPIGKAKLAEIIRRQYHIRYGEELSAKWPTITDGRLVWNWRNRRKQNCKILRDGWAINSGRGQSEFVGDVDATVYAYAGRVGDTSGAIKLGYTAQKIETYLKTRELSHTPKLMATTPGNLELEAAFHERCRRWKVSIGREWFEPNSEILEFIVGNYQHRQPDIERVFANAQYEYFGMVK